MTLLHSTQYYVRRLAIAGYLMVQWVYQTLSPLVRKKEREVQLTRDTVELALAYLVENRKNCVDGPVLIDAMWDNPNYWVRLSLLRAALGTSVLEEKALLGRYSKLAVKRTLEKIGISIIGQFEDFATNRRKALVEAKILLAETNTPEEILKWKLPECWPPGIVYDGILKRQASSRVDLSDPYLPKYLAEALLAIEAARCVVDEIQPKLIVLSHCIQFDYGALAWMALARGIPAVVLFGNYGMSRFFRLSVEDDLYDWMSSPCGMDLDALHQDQKELLQSIGHSYLEKRLGGKTDDIGAIYAFQQRSGMINRKGICERFGWDPQLPVVAVYGSNWFDFPHALGMRNFCDFHDWLDATLEVAIKNSGVNWLFKSHPVDELYGGITLEELIKSKTRSNIRLVPKDWNGNAVMASIDAMVTYHSTSGIEFASMGKPVLLADRGCYHDAGFALWPESREKYLQHLTSPWWKKLDMDYVRERAETFAGFYFCQPEWQEAFILKDDSKQNAIYHTLPTLIEDNHAIIEREIDTLRRWWHEGETLYHTFKMKESTSFKLSNVPR